LHHFVLPEERRFFWTLQRGRPTEKTSGWDTFKPSVYIVDDRFCIKEDRFLAAKATRS
jgi:hypothetical protein